MESIKICRFKTFRAGYIDKKLSSPSLFIIYMLKIVFCIDISAEYIVWSKCRNLSGNTFSKLHRDSSLLAKASRWNLPL